MCRARAASMTKRTCSQVWDLFKFPLSAAQSCPVPLQKVGGLETIKRCLEIRCVAAPAHKSSGVDGAGFFVSFGYDLPQDFNVGAR